MISYKEYPHCPSGYSFFLKNHLPDLLTKKSHIPLLFTSMLLRLFLLEQKQLLSANTTTHLLASETVYILIPFPWFSSIIPTIRLCLCYFSSYSFKIFYKRHQALVSYVMKSAPNTWKKHYFFCVSVCCLIFSQLSIIVTCKNQCLL